MVLLAHISAEPTAILYGCKASHAPGCHGVTSVTHEQCLVGCEVREVFRNRPFLLLLLSDFERILVCAEESYQFASSMRTSSSPIISFAISNRLLSGSKSPPNLNFKWWNPLLIASLISALGFSSEYPSQLALVV